MVFPGPTMSLILRGRCRRAFGTVLRFGSACR